MTPVLNPPLYTGQVLEPRRLSKYPKCRIVDFCVIHSGMEWILKGENGAEYRLSLSEVYKQFKFDDCRETTLD